jgi:hypothetical protein
MPILKASPSRSRKPWATRFVTRRWTVEVGIPVASRISPRVSVGRVSVKASRMALIFPSTSNGLLGV